MPFGTGPVVVNGQLGLQSYRQSMAYQGKMFLVSSVVNTPIAYALVTSYSATANGLFSISNSNALGGNVIQLDRLHMIQTATAPTGTLKMEFEFYSESGIMVIGTAAAAKTPVNVNPSFSNTTGATCTFFNAGAGTVPAAAGVRRFLGETSIATGLGIIHDSYTVEFGADGFASQGRGGAAVRSADPADLACAAPPITIAPQCSAYCNMWWLTAAANTPSFAFWMTYFEG